MILIKYRTIEITTCIYDRYLYFWITVCKRGALPIRHQSQYYIWKKLHYNNCIIFWIRITDFSINWHIVPILIDLSYFSSQKYLCFPRKNLKTVEIIGNFSTVIFIMQVPINLYFFTCYFPYHLSNLRERIMLIFRPNYGAG